MVGNDIIDLNASKLNSRWEEQRFLDKLFTSNEQEFILAGESRLNNIWLLWSMKESAYKIVARTNKTQTFNPKAFRCQLSSESNNTVSFENQYFHTKTILEKEFIYTTAFSDWQKVSTNWVRLEKMDIQSQNIETMRACMKAFAERTSISEASISIKNNELGIPQLYIESILQKECISMTHHGYFGGFAIAI